MRTIRKVVLFLSSMAIMLLSVLILLLVSLVSMIFNAVLFILMVSALAIPVSGNMLANKVAGQSGSSHT